MTKTPDTIDFTALQFLGYGDMKEIAKKHKEENPGRKTSAWYVGQIVKKKRGNDEILALALERGLQKQGRFPKQVIKK